MHRSLLHKLLLGDGPFTFSPFPPSQVTHATHRSLSVTESFIILQLRGKYEAEEEKKENSFTCENEGEGDENEEKWTPLPQPNMEALLRRLPLPPMTAEELCAPSSDEEDEKEVRQKVKRDRESVEKEGGEKLTRKLVNPMHVISGGGGGGEIEGDPCSSSSIRHHPIPALSNTETLTSDVSDQKKPSTVSDFIKDIRKDRQHAVDSVVPVRNNVNGPKSTPSGNVIDLTGQSLQQQTSRSDSTHQTTSQDHTSSAPTSVSSGNPAAQSSSSAGPSYEVEDDEDFDVLCLDIDLSTLDDFSDTEPEVAVETRPAEHLSHNTISNPISSTVSSTTSNTASSTASNTVSNTASSTASSRMTSTTSSKGKGRASQSGELGGRHTTGVKRQGDVGTGSRSKQIRLDLSEQQLGTSQRTEITREHSVFRGSDLPGTSNTANASIRQESHSLPLPHRVSHSTAQQPTSSHTDRATDRARTNTNARGPPQRSDGARPQVMPAAVEATSSSGGRGRVTPLGSRLTTENCPMCNTKFPSW